MNWSDLSMSQRSDLMQIYLKNGITSLDEMKKHYNSFAEGGDTGKPPYKRYYATPQYGFSPLTSDVATYNLEREVAKKSSANSMKDRKNAAFVDYDRNKEENLKEQAREEEEELQARKDFATSMSLAGAAIGYKNPILGAMMQIPDAYMDWRYGRYPAAETSFNGLLETMSIADNSVIGDKVENVLFKVPKYGKFLGGGYHLFRRGNDYLIPVGVSNDASDLLTGRSMIEHIGSTLEDNDKVAANMLRASAIRPH